MQPHTGAALCVFSFLIPDFDRKFFPQANQQTRDIFFPYNQFSVKSTMPSVLHKGTNNKTYSITIGDYYNDDILRLKIGQHWNCYLTMNILRYTPSEKMIEFEHSHSGPIERVTLRSDVIDGEYNWKVKKDSHELRKLLMITVDRDVDVRHHLVGGILTKQGYNNPEGTEDRRMISLEIYDHLTKETNPVRKFNYRYEYKIDSTNSLPGK